MDERERKLRKLTESMSPEQLKAAIETASIIRQKRAEGMIYAFSPNEAQVPILQSKKKIKVITGGNRSGKTHCSAYETACHITGIYPPDWTGSRFNNAINVGVVSVDTGQMVKGVQQKLMGWPNEFGTGFIPKAKILEYKERPQTNGCLDWLLVQHISGGTSRVNFMTYEQNIKAFMGFDWQLCLFDEEPPYRVFEEVRMRMLDKGGNMILSFYPSEGQTPLLTALDTIEEKTPEFIDHFYLEWFDNPTLDAEQVKMEEALMDDDTKEHRKYGRVGIQEGQIFPWKRDRYVCDPFQIESSWPQIAGFDVGFGHPTGAINLAVDPFADVVYVFREYLIKEALPPIIGSALRNWGDVEFKIDPSSRRRSPTDGQRLFEMYGKPISQGGEGLVLSKANNDIISSLNEINKRISQGKLWIFSSCRELIRQMALYRRRRDANGNVNIVKKDDDLVDPLRYAILALGEARIPGAVRPGPPQVRIRQWQPMDKRLGI